MQEIQKCKTGLFYELRTKNTGLTYRPTHNVEINADGVNVILYENENIVIGTQGPELRIGGFKIG